MYVKCLLCTGTFDELKLIEVVGEGTFGIVHKAIWRGTIVAAKLINVPSGSEASVKKEIELCRYIIMHGYR